MKEARQREHVIPVELIELERELFFATAAHRRTGDDFAITRNACGS